MSSHHEDPLQLVEQALTDDRLRGLTVSTEDGHRAIRADLERGASA